MFRRFLFMVTSLTEYVQVDKQVLEEILREVRELKKLATPTPTPSTLTAVIEGVKKVSCSAALASEQK